MIPKPKVVASIPVTRSNPVKNRSQKSEIRSQPTGVLKSLLLLIVSPVLFACPAFAQDTSNGEVAPVAVLSFKWQRDRRAAELADTSSNPTTPAPAMIAQNKNFARQVRANEPAGVRDPNQDTLDGRSAELDRITAEARAAEKPKTDGFTYRAKVQNNSGKLVSRVFWEYQFKEKGNPAILSRRQFVCLAKLKPESTKDFEIFTLNAPTAVVTVNTMGKKAENSFDEAVIINRVEFADSTTWQRKDWVYDDVKLTAQPSSDSKKLQPCRGL